MALMRTSRTKGKQGKKAVQAPPQPRRSGRPRLQESVPRDSILGEAARLFRERGYQGTTVRDIAAAVGIQPGSLFHHFASKEQLLVEMLREASLSLCIGAESAVDPEAPLPERLGALVHFELNCLVGERTRHRFAVLVSEWRDVPDAARPELQMLRQRYFATWRQLLAECREAGLLRLEPDAALRIIHGANTGAVVWFRKSGRYSTSEFADIVTRLVLVDSVASNP